MAHEITPLHSAPSDVDRIAKLEMVVALLIKHTVCESVERNMLLELLGITEGETMRAWNDFRRIYLENVLRPRYER